MVKAFSIIAVTLLPFFLEGVVFTTLQSVLVSVGFGRVGWEPSGPTWDTFHSNGDTYLPSAWRWQPSLPP